MPNQDVIHYAWRSISCLTLLSKSTKTSTSDEPRAVASTPVAGAEQSDEGDGVGPMERKLWVDASRVRS